MKSLKWMGFICWGREEVGSPQKGQLEEPFRRRVEPARPEPARGQSFKAKEEPVAAKEAIAECRTIPAATTSPWRFPCCSRRRRPAPQCNGDSSPSVAQPPLQRTKSCLDEELRWPGSAAEMASVAEVRRRVAKELEGAPEDMAHDLSIARFLRGHGGDVVKAAEFMNRALRYRKDLVKASPEVRRVREAAAASCCVDMSQLPHASDALKVLPIRAVEGTTREGLPVMLTAARLIDFQAIVELMEQTDVFSGFLAAHFEQRSMVLHKLSLQQGRMVKFVDVRDMTGASILAMLHKGRPFIAKVKSILQVIQDYYPEMIHQVIMFNAPAAVARIKAIINTILNERMRAKLQFFPVVEAYNEVIGRLTARAILSWMKQTQSTSFNDFELGRGVEEYAVQWLSKGQTLRWKATVQWKELKLRFAFVAEAAGGVSRPRPEELTLEADAPREGAVGPVDSDGLVWIALNNSTAWTACKVKELVLRCA